MSDKPLIITFKLFPGRDDDLIAWLKSLGSREKSSYIRMAIREQFIVCRKPLEYSVSPGPTLSPAPEDVIDQCDSGGRKELSDEELEERLSRW